MFEIIISVENGKYSTFSSRSAHFAFPPLLGYSLRKCEKSYQSMLPGATWESQRRTISGAGPPNLYVKHVSKSNVWVDIPVSSFFVCPLRFSGEKWTGRGRDYRGTNSLRVVIETMFPDFALGVAIVPTQVVRIDFDKRARRIAECVRACVRVCFYAKCTSDRARVERTCCLWGD